VGPGACPPVDHSAEATINDTNDFRIGLLPRAAEPECDLMRTDPRSSQQHDPGRIAKPARVDGTGGQDSSTSESRDGTSTDTKNDMHHDPKSWESTPGYFR
jgi:hypothetical protein